MHFLSENQLTRILSRDELMREEVRIALRTVRHGERKNEALVYAETLVPEADLLSPYSLGALVRADISEAEAIKEVKRNKAFCIRLAGLLPSILEFFGNRDSSAGLLSMIDDCHG